MTSYQLANLCIRVNRSDREGRQVYELVRSLGIPDESIEPFLEATAELANLADRLSDEPPAGSWLRIAEQAAELIGLTPAFPTQLPISRASRSASRCARCPVG